MSGATALPDTEGRLPEDHVSQSPPLAAPKAPICTRRITINQAKVGPLIGKGGLHLNMIRDLSGAAVSLDAPLKENYTKPAVLRISSSSQQKVSFAVQLCMGACNGGFIRLASASLPVHRAKISSIEDTYGVRILALSDGRTGDAHACVLPLTKEAADNVGKAAEKLRRAQKNPENEQRVAETQQRSLDRRVPLPAPAREQRDICLGKKPPGKKKKDPKGKQKTKKPM